MTGFHAAFFGSALFFVAGIVVMITLLKRGTRSRSTPTGR